MDITRKSTGMLFDEYQTNEIKIKELGTLGELLLRRAALSSAIIERDDSNTKIGDQSKLDKLLTQLQKVLQSCWDAQDVVMSVAKTLEENKNKTLLWPPIEDYEQGCYAAIDAQAFNAKRNELIREIDEYFGELEYSPTIKSYRSK